MKKILLGMCLAITVSLAGCGTESNYTNTSNVSTTKPTTPPANKSSVCTEELQRCPDGSAVGRNSANSCNFDPCPKGQTPKMAREPKMCPMDVKMCADGSAVGRDSMNNCAFKPCKTAKP